MEVFTNCATAGASFTKFYLLLNGAGVGRAYDDALCPVDWAEAPELLLYLSPAHPDWPKDRAALHRFGVEFGLLRWGMGDDGRLLAVLPELDYAGAVIEGMGAGHVPAEAAEAGPHVAMPSVEEDRFHGNEHVQRGFRRTLNGNASQYLRQ